MGNCAPELGIENKAYRIITLDEVREHITRIGSVQSYDTLKSFMIQVPMCINIQHDGFAIWKAYPQFRPAYSSSFPYGMNFDLIMMLDIANRSEAQVGLTQEQYEFLIR